LVISVQDSLSSEPVAVKCITKVFDKVILARRALREITLLRHFGGHENLTGWVWFDTGPRTSLTGSLIDLDYVWDDYNEM
jgi:mitogen-activated protein kinase 7